MTTHDGLGSVRADRRKDAAERATRPEARGVDVAEGRRLLAAMDEAQSGEVGPYLEKSVRAMEWAKSNVRALLDAAEERAAIKRIVQSWDETARDRIIDVLSGAPSVSASEDQS